jgi:hypothetical protein
MKMEMERKTEKNILRTTVIVIDEPSRRNYH